MGPVELWVTIIVATAAASLAVWTAWAWSRWRRTVIQFLTEIRDLLRKREQ